MGLQLSEYSSLLHQSEQVREKMEWQHEGLSQVLITQSWMWLPFSFATFGPLEISHWVQPTHKGKWLYRGGNNKETDQLGPFQKMPTTSLYKLFQEKTNFWDLYCVTSVNFCKPSWIAKCPTWVSGSNIELLSMFIWWCGSSKRVPTMKERWVL